ncbi:hypothetical protein NXS98_09140 [Fontisphaera persica]|uniref:hypothetical protein n=1 Tax=Fontisphaera persica TaxID=2974023 RepID=UPI0024C09D6E|nr:hypothetical protein [Fontisphaera persica]WCJ57895.1 hypothetical protein NXS98_09140 [Fontisphaera persica]
MPKSLKIVALAVAVMALVVMLLAVWWFCAGRLGHEAAKQVLTVGTVVWFAAALPLRFLGRADP